MMRWCTVQYVAALRYKPKGRGFDSRWCHWNSSLAWSFRPLYGPGVDSALKEMGTRNNSLRAKAAVAWDRQPYYLHVPIALKSRSLTLMEPSGPAQAWTGKWIAVCRRRHNVLASRYERPCPLELVTSLLMTIGCGHWRIPNISFLEPICNVQYSWNKELTCCLPGYDPMRSLR